MKGRIDTASRTIKASPETLYRAFTDPNAYVKWLPPKGMTGQIEKFEPVVHGAYRVNLIYGDEDFGQGKTTQNTDVSEGIFLELVENKKIKLSVTFDSEQPSFSEEMIQTWYFEELPEGTKVTIICENVPLVIRKADHDEGLNATLENLAQFTE